ncbi:MAG TPA: SMI1/KNR4 family protein [Gemmataceae bacterium]|jgi:hypothetical protein
MSESLDIQVAELRSLLIARVGEPKKLYSLVYDGYSVVGMDEAEEDDSPLCRILCPPVADEVVTAAEASLGFALPSLLRAVYTRIGNGGLCLRLLGLAGGQPGGEDLFPGLSAVEIYHELEGWRRDGKIAYLPSGLLPLNDDLGCGMVDYVDCRTAEGKVWRTDSGSLSERQPALFAYFREAIEGYRSLVQKHA